MRLQFNASFQINRNFQQLPHLAQHSLSQVTMEYLDMCTVVGHLLLWQVLDWELQ